MRILAFFVAFTFQSSAFAINSDMEFPDFTSGISIDGQNGWVVPGPIDESITIEPANQFWRISNAFTDESFDTQPHSPAASLYSGESLSIPASTHNSISASFDFWSITGATQTDLSVTHSIDEGNGGRLTFFDIEDNGAGLDIRVVDYDGTTPTGFNSTIAANNLDYTTRHKVRVEMCANDGPAKVGIAEITPPNDIVRFYVDGQLAYTGSSLEQMYIDGPGLDISTSCNDSQNAALSCAASASASATYISSLESLFNVTIAAPQGASEVCAVLPNSADFPFPAGNYSTGAKTCVLECEQQFWTTQANNGQCNAMTYASLIPTNDNTYQACINNCDQNPWGVNQQLFRVSNAAVPALSGAGLGIDNVETVVFTQDCNNPQVDMAIQINASPTSNLLAGDNVTLTLNTDNIGTSFASGVDVLVNLPAGLSYVSDDCNLIINGQALTWNIGESGPPDAISANLSCTIQTSVQSISFASVSAQVGSTETDSDSLNNTDNVSLSGLTYPIPTLTEQMLFVMFVLILLVSIRYRQQIRRTKRAA